MNKQTMMRLSLVSSAIIGISLLHYLTPLHLPMLHDIFQRLYYIPIILAAFWFGFRGGLSSAIVVSVLYAPHILFQWGGHLTMELEKYLEIILYNVVGGITGLLSQQERTRASQLQETARGLEESNEQLRRQSELILEIEGQMRRAERLSVLGELSAALAHEIRNPLGSIKGAAEILRDDYRPGDRKYEFLEILVGETERLDRVVEEFLRLARPRTVESGVCDVMEELRNMITLVSAEAKRRGVELKLEPAALPGVTGDREKLRQAFLNIILNGLQATLPGGMEGNHNREQRARRGSRRPGRDMLHRHRRRYRFGYPGQNIRSVFYHQGGGYRPGARHNREDYCRAWRKHRRGKRAGPRHYREGHDSRAAGDRR